MVRFALPLFLALLTGCPTVALMESAEITPAGTIEGAAGINLTPLVLEGLNDADQDGVADWPIPYASGMVRGGLGRGFDFGTRINLVSLSVDLRYQVLDLEHLHAAVAPEFQFQFGGAAWGARMPVGYKLENGTELLVTPRFYRTLGGDTRQAKLFAGGTATLRLGLSEGQYFIIPEVTVMRGITDDTPLWPTFSLGGGFALDL